MRLYRIMVALLLLTTALIGSMILVGRANATPNGTQLLRLGVCDDRPCFMGIAPGITDWENARAQLAKYVDPDTGAFRFAVGGMNADVMPDAGKASIIVLDRQNLDGTVSENLPTADSFVRRFGAPCSVTASGLPYGFTLNYPYMQVSLGAETGNISPDDPVVELQIMDPTITFEAPPDLCASNNNYGYTVVPWLGFTSLADYEAHGFVPQWW